MKQDQQPWLWWKDNRLLWAIVALVLIILAIIATLGHVQGWPWTEIIWRWLELLIIPVVLAAGACWLNTQARRREPEQELARRKSEQELALQARESEQELAQRERENDRQIAEDRVREEALQRYLNTMKELILDKGLRKSKKDAEVREVRNVARAMTLAVLRSLDGNGKGHIVRFLYEADLIGPPMEESGEWQPEKAIIRLKDADLSTAYLEEVTLVGVDLSYTNLSNAILHRSVMNYCRLVGANLMKANLQRANLFQTNLSSADLRVANLSGAKEWTNNQLAQAASLVGATMPDGTKMTEEAWEEFKKRYRK